MLKLKAGNALPDGNLRNPLQHRTYLEVYIRHRSAEVGDRKFVATHLNLRLYWAGDLCMCTRLEPTSVDCILEDFYAS